MTGAKFFTHLFGDSSYITSYLRWLGYDLGEIVQTGSNFGLDVRQENPYMCIIGSGTMVADGLAIMNSDVSATSFRVSPVYIGGDSFFGNNIYYPAGGRVGNNCLIATKAMIPLDGKVREGVGLLGSPSFEIPRTVERDQAVELDELEQRRRLRAKNRHNLRTMGIFLFVRWLYVFLITTFALAALDAYGGFAQLEMGLLLALSILITPVYFVLVERLVTGFRLLQPQYCSIYDPYFWRHERLWKVPADRYIHMFNGTPFKSLVWRGLGAKVGKKVFDDGWPFHGAGPDQHRRRRHAQRRIRDPVPFTGGRRVQVRPDRDRQRLHSRGRRVRPLRREDGRPLGARPRFIPDERRGDPAACAVGGKPREGDVT